MELPADRPENNALAGYAMLALAVLVAAAVTVYLFASGGGETGTAAAGNGTVPGARGVLTPAPNTGPLESRRPEIGQPAPDFALVDARDGTTIRKLSDFRGKGVIVNWYASWCGPCRSEIPDFQAAQNALPDELVVFGVDFLESRERAVSILELLYAKYPAVLDGAGEVATQWRVGAGLPTTFFVDKDGVLRGMKTGRVTPAELEENLGKLGIAYTAAR